MGLTEEDYTWERYAAVLQIPPAERGPDWDEACKRAWEAYNDAQWKRETLYNVLVQFENGEDAALFCASLTSDSVEQSLLERMAPDDGSFAYCLVTHPAHRFVLKVIRIEEVADGTD